MDYGRGECTLSDHRPVRGIFEIKVIIIDQTTRDALRTQLYQLKNKPLTKPALPARPKNVMNAKPALPPADPALIDLSDKVEQDLLLSDGISRNPFLQQNDISTWKTLEPARSNLPEMNSLNPFRND